MENWREEFQKFVEEYADAGREDGGAFTSPRAKDVLRKYESARMMELKKVANEMAEKGAV